MNKLLIVGTVAFDAIETPFGKTDKILGGSASYIGLSASYFQTLNGIVSVVGNDFPKEYFTLLQNKNIDLTGVETIADGKTFFWKGRYHNNLNSRDTLETQLNVLADFSPVVPENFKDADVLLLGNLHPSIQISVVNQMSRRPKLILLDTMNFWMDNSLAELKEALQLVDVITINDEEARQLSGEYSLRKTAKMIADMGPKFVIIKKGEHGALLFHKEEVFFAPALPLEEVFDPTGAGDSFAGGFAAYLTEQDVYNFDTMKKALIHGSNMASFCVEKFGTDNLVNLSKKQIDQRLQEFKKLSHF
ncbi:PfkB family carbohydrate kinase [Capnocytophaga sp. ARDL2]|uniref:PfkB family carbohydrate kinase n=1 Tax=Capnocytophaga sp. ARDL2 TaxID=3238809 RepID=UPI003557E38F